MEIVSYGNLNSMVKNEYIISDDQLNRDLYYEIYPMVFSAI